MVINTKLSFAFLLFSLFFLSVTFSLAVANVDPELQLCKSQCWTHHEFSHRQRRECEQKCEDYHGQNHGEGEGEGGGGTRIVLNSNTDPEKQLQQCQKQCERQREQQKEQCRRQCQDTYERQRGEEGKGGGGQSREKDEQGRQEEQEQEQGQEQQEQNPYVFQDQHYTASLETNEGRIKILQRFHQRSRLLRGLKNYRFVYLEANPQTFVLPAHLDAEAVVYVASGRGTLSLVSQGKRESFNIKQGDIVRIRAGTTIYMINRDKNKKLRIAKLLQPVALPDEFQPFYGPAGENPQSFYRAFSEELLSSALKVEQDRVQRVIKQQNKGVIVKASEQQIQALSQREESGMFPFPFGSTESKRVFNLLSKEPSISNRYGRLHEADANEFQQLQDMDIAVSYSNITKGSMEGPFFNTRATKIAVVVKGEGYMEMACPHVSQQQQGQGQSTGEQRREQQHQSASPHYQRLSSPLKRGMLFVVPAGHPLIVVAGNNRNLEIVCFDVNAENNRRESLAGDKNIVNALEKEAKELAFSIPAREVDEVFAKQNEWWFFPGPRGGHAYA